MREMGILEDCWELSDRDPSQPPWGDAQHKEWNQRRMEVYAAQIDRMDQGIGKLLHFGITLAYKCKPTPFMSTPLQAYTYRCY